MNTKIIGIDLAKNTFQVCGLNQANKVLFNKALSRQRLPLFIQQLPPTLIAMESCGSSNYWARKFQAMGHEVKLVPAQHVKPFVKGNKNDRNDALAICEAAQRPKMCFTQVKSQELLDIQMLHRIRQRYVQASTAMANQIRAFLSEHGIIIDKRIENLIHTVPLILEDADNGLSDLARQMVKALYDDILKHRKEVEAINQRLTDWVNSREDGRRLLKLPGYGPILSTALIAAVGNGSQFTRGRQLSAWVGLTPSHFGTGGSNIVMDTRKQGNNYLRTLLIHGARTVVTWAGRKEDPLSLWIDRLVERRGKRKAYVALANKTTRAAWHLLQGKDFDRKKMAA